MNEKPWYAQWKFWLCLIILILVWIITWPFKLLERLF